MFSGGTGVIDQGIGAVTSGASYTSAFMDGGSITYTLTVTNAQGVSVSRGATWNSACPVGGV